MTRFILPIVFAMIATSSLTAQTDAKVDDQQEQLSQRLTAIENALDALRDEVATIRRESLPATTTLDDVPHFPW